jgi:DNA-binding transcriptional LysR family regulator
VRAHDFAELTTFEAVARLLSFSKAAVDLGVSAATVSQTIRSLEDKLGVRLLNRTTRSVSITEAGEQLLTRLQPALASVDDAIQVISTFRESPIGTLRLKVARMPAMMMLGPLLGRFIQQHPDIGLDIVVDDQNTDIVSGRFDAGIHVGSQVEMDMIAIRLTGEFRLVTVASAAYLEASGGVAHPKDVADLSAIRFRVPWGGTVPRALYERDGQRIEVATSGPLIVNDMILAVQAALDGVGIVQLPEQLAAKFLADGRLVTLLDDWAPVLPGFYLYHSSTRQQPPVVRALIDFMHANLGVDGMPMTPGRVVTKAKQVVPC